MNEIELAVAILKKEKEEYGRRINSMKGLLKTEDEIKERAKGKRCLTEERLTKTNDRRKKMIADCEDGIKAIDKAIEKIETLLK